MQYFSVSEVSEKWGVSVRQVQRLLADGRIIGAKKYARAWMIPDDAKKPMDPRDEKRTPMQWMSSEMARVIEATSMPMPSDHPDSILTQVSDERSRRQYEAELAYLRGDFARALCCYREAKEDPAAKLRASLIGVAAAISLGDYHAYKEIEVYLKDCRKVYPASDLSIIAELALASVGVSVVALNMIPSWLKDGDFRDFPSQAGPAYMLYIRARYFLCVGQYEGALCVAQTALTFQAKAPGITLTGIYLEVVCALACHCLEREEEAKHWLLEAMRLAMPHGFITPFAEAMSDFGGIVEQCLEEEFPEQRAAVITQWNRTVINWISFHNQFTKENITLLLSLREYHLAQMVARRVPYAQIAKHYNISVGRLKNIMLEIYQKLLVSGRDELGEYVLILKQRKNTDNHQEVEP